MELLDSFNSTLFIPNITSLYSIQNVLSALGSFDEASRKKVMSELEVAGISKRISVGVKKLIYMIEMASQDEEKVEKLVGTIQEDGLGPSFA
jgi:vesicle-fusing ATPase